MPVSILEFWSYNRTLISQLDDKEIIDTLNTPNLLSPMTGRQIFLHNTLGGPMVRDVNGTIVSASVLKANYILENRETFDKAKSRNVSIRWQLFFMECTLVGFITKISAHITKLSKRRTPLITGQ